MGYIYSITNKINNKKYIGKTEYNNPIKRWQEHLRDSKRFDRPLYKAIRKYGKENFIFEVLFSDLYGEELCEKEVETIKNYGTYHNGYNATLGGDGKTFLNHDLIYKTYLSTKNMTETSKLCNCSIDSVRMVLNTYGISKETRIQNGKEQTKNRNYGRPVAKVDKKTDEIIFIYKNMTEAAKDNPKAHREHIGRVCKGERKTAGGFKWKYV